MEHDLRTYWQSLIRVRYVEPAIESKLSSDKQCERILFKLMEKN